MAYAQRKSFPAELYYIVVSQSALAPPIEDGERPRLSTAVAKTLPRFGARAHAFCWTLHDARLLVEVENRSLEAFSGRLACTMSDELAQARRKRVQLRYDVAPVQGFFEAVEMLRHIHQTPRFAGLRGTWLHYKWSSHRMYLGCASMRWLTTNRLLSFFDDDPFNARQLYRECLVSTQPISSSSRAMRLLTRFEVGDPQRLALLRRKSDSDGQRTTAAVVTLAERRAGRKHVSM